MSTSQSLKLSQVKTLLPKWRGLSVPVIDKFENAYGHKFYIVELPFKDFDGNPQTAIVTGSQIEEVSNAKY